jgi:hypothetical protein
LKRAHVRLRCSDRCRRDDDLERVGEPEPGQHVAKRDVPVRDDREFEAGDGQLVEHGTGILICQK